MPGRTRRFKNSTGRLYAHELWRLRANPFWGCVGFQSIRVRPRPSCQLVLVTQQNSRVIDGRRRD